MNPALIDTNRSSTCRELTHDKPGAEGLTLMSLLVAEVWVDPKIGPALESQGRVGVRITGSVGVDDLRAAVDRSLETFFALWDAEEPEYQGLLVKEPLAAVATVSPAVMVTFSEADHLGLAYPRLREALLDGLPAGTRVKMQATARRRPAVDVETRLLHMRIALKASPEREEGKGFPWREGPQAAEFIDNVLSDWLTALPGAALSMPQHGYQQVFVKPEQVRETLRGKRNDDWQACLVSVSGRDLRAVDMSYRYAWVSLVIGESSPDPSKPFDWRQALHELEAVLNAVESVVHLALVQHTGLAQEGAMGAYYSATRHLFRIPTRNPLNSGIERDLERNGIVDAEGVLYFSRPPQGLPETWTHEPFGQLVRVIAPNPDEWLAHKPTEETLERGRGDLAALLAEPSWPPPTS